MNWKTLTLCVAALALTVPAMAANTLQVTTAAAMEGTYGLEISFDGVTPNNLYVQDDSPTQEVVYRAQFMIAMNTHNGNVGDKHALLKLRDLSGPIANPVTVGLRDEGAYYVAYVKLIDDSNPVGIFRADGGQAFETIVPATPVTLMIEYVQSTANDGIFRLYKNGTLRREITTLNLNSTAIDRVQLGCLGIRNFANPSGSYYLDSFESYRTLAP